MILRSGFEGHFLEMGMSGRGWNAGVVEVAWWGLLLCLAGYDEAGRTRGVPL